MYHELGHCLDYVSQGEVEKVKALGTISAQSKESLAEFKRLCQYNYLPDANSKNEGQQTEDFGDFIAAKALNEIDEKYYQADQLQPLFKELCQLEVDAQGHGSGADRALHLVQHDHKMQETLNCRVENVCPVN